MVAMILQLEQISKSFGGRVLFQGVNIRLEEYDHLALVGPNGAGKTTLLRIISGEEDADEGRVVLAKDAHIGYLEQEAIEMGENPVFEEVLSSQSEITYNFSQIMDKEAKIVSVFRYRNIYPKAIAAVAKGAIDVKRIVTHEFDLDHIQEAYDEAVNNKTDLVKSVIKIK